MSADRLGLQNLTREFPTPDGPPLVILDHVTAVFEPGETVAITGPSGSGKSTLLNLIGALDVPTAGTVHLGEVEVTSLSGAELAAYRATRIGFVFQDHHLLPQLTALENVLLPTLALPHATSVKARAQDLLERIGLQARRDAFPAQMSGGERQRVAIARALVNQPSLLLCDEPTGNLDRTTGADVVTLLLELAQGQGVTVLMVTHNLEQATRFSRCLQLRGGKLEVHCSSGGETR